MRRKYLPYLIASTLGLSGVGAGVGACVGEDPTFVPVTDAGATPDATTDTGGEADAGSLTTFCSAVDAAFCADFDRDQDAAASFARWVARGGATLERTVADYASPPGSLWLRLPAADGGYEASGFASAILDVNASQHRTVEVEVALRADEPSTGKVQFLTISRTSTTSRSSRARSSRRRPRARRTPSRSSSWPPRPPVRRRRYRPSTTTS